MVQYQQWTNRKHLCSSQTKRNEDIIQRTIGVFQNGRKMTSIYRDVKLILVLWLYLNLVKIHETYTLTSINCPNRLMLTAEREPKYITSPNYPGNYGVLGKRLSCSWVINANASFDDVVIEMYVHNSSLEPATGCWRDVVEVIDGNQDFHPSLKSWCGSGGPSGTFKSSAAVAYVKFGTNFRDNDYYGFLMSYWVVKKHKYIVNYQPWTKLNFVLFGISMVLIGSVPVCLVIIAIVRAIQARQLEKQQKQT